MFFLYTILLAVGFLVFLPRFLFQKKYAAGFRERLGNLPDFDADGKLVVWLHCVSVGEAQAARPLVKSLRESFPDIKLVVSTTTLTGQNLAREIFKDSADLVFFFPLDFKFTVRRALRKIQPDIVLLTETELWFNFIREAGKFGAKVIIVNGRLSEKSARRYGYIKNTLQRVLHYVELALMQEHADAKRLTNLGLRPSKVKITGNLKFDQPVVESETELTNRLKKRFGLTAEDPLIVAASTHAPEEELILAAFKTVYKNSTGKLPRLMLVPRHPERFDEVSDLIKLTGFDWVRRSEKDSNRDFTAEIILLDSIGELRSVYPLAEIVFVGGSLIPHGGQSIFEPAEAQKAIVTGFYTMNFSAVVKEFTEKHALIQLPKLEEKEVVAKLAEIFSALLKDESQRKKLSQNAFQVMQSNRGATDKTIQYLKPIFEVQSQKLSAENSHID